VDYHNLPVTIVSAGSGVGYGSLGYTHHAIQDYSLIRSFPNMLIASPGDVMELRSCMDYLISNPQPSYLRLEKSSQYQIHKRKPNISPGKWIKVFDHKKNVNNKEIYLTTGAVIEFVKDKIDKKKYKPRSLFSIPLWGMKFKKNQNKNLQNFKKIIVVEDHLKDGGLQSWLNESFTNEKLISKSINSKVIGKVGSKKFLMNYLK
jgi:transketolase